MSSSPQAAVFVCPTQSINELLETQHTTSLTITTMMYSLLSGGPKEAVTARDSLVESGGSQEYCQQRGGMILCNAGTPQR